MTDHKISIPCSMNFCPSGISAFAQLLHVVYAHFRNPVDVGNGDHHAAAKFYIEEHVSRDVTIKNIHADASSAEYIIACPGRPLPIQVRISIGRPLEHTVSVWANGTQSYIPVDIRTVRVLP